MRWAVPTCRSALALSRPSVPPSCGAALCRLEARRSGRHPESRAGEMIPEVEGTRPRGPRGKGSPSVSKGPKPPIQLLQLLKNNPREVKRAHFRYILCPPGSHPGYGIYGARRGRSPPAPPPVSPAMPESQTLLGEGYRIPTVT